MKYNNTLQVFKDYCLKTLSYHLEHPLVKPERINIATTFSCPLNCEMCSIPETDEGGNELTVDQWKEILRQVADWGIRHVSFSGGETMSRKEKTLELLKFAKDLGLEIDLITNGMFFDDETVKEILETGVDRVTLSVEGSTEERHDKIRGEGSFESVMNAAKKLNKYRRITDYVEYEFSTVVLNKNYDDLLDIYDLMKEMDFDFINYQALLPDNSFERDQGYNDELWLNEGEVKELRETVEELITIKEETGDIRNTKKYLRKMPEYFREREKFDYGKCMAAYEVIHIDPYGYVDLCGLGPKINIMENKIWNVWKGEKFNKIREKTKKCDKPCLLLCYRRLDLEDVLKTHVEASIADA